MPEQNQNPGSSATVPPVVSAAAPVEASSAPVKKPSVRKTAPRAAARAVVPAPAAAAPEPIALKSAKELQDVSLAFLDGPTAPDPKAAPEPPAATAAAENTETAVPTEPATDTPETEGGSEESSPTEPLPDPGDDHVEQAFSPEAQAGPKWFAEVLAKLPEGTVPDWFTKRATELVDKALSKSAALREKEARIAELEEVANELRTQAPAPGDVRGALARETNVEQLQAHLDHAQRWIDWATQVRPDADGFVPNPTDVNGEAWTLQQVHEKLTEERARERAATAQIKYIEQRTPAHEEAKKILPAMFDTKSEERKLAQAFLDENPWLNQKGNKDAIIARYVLGEMEVRARANGVRKVTVQTAKPAVATITKTASAKPAAVTSAPLRASGTQTPLEELRKRQAAGDPNAARELAERFLA